MDLEELHLLLDRLRAIGKENEWLEFKDSNTKAEEIGKRISALSNGACLHNKEYGYLIFGIEDGTGKIIGTKNHLGEIKKGNEELEHWVYQRLNPRIDFKVYDFYRDGDKLSILEIPAARYHPVRFSNDSYIRIGSITRKLRDFPEKERQIWLKTSSKKFEKQIAKAKVAPEDLNNVLSFDTYFELLGMSIPMRIDKKIEYFENEKLIIKAGIRYNITNLGALLFAKDLNDFENLSRKAIRLITYTGKNKLEIHKDWQGKKGYALAFRPLISFIKAQLPSSEIIKESIRERTEAYPSLAIRELIANAIIHQDLEINGSGPVVEIFSDRIEIVSQGKPVIDILRFIDYPSRTRNESLASLMRKLNICEERGSGIDKVIYSCEDMQLPPPNFYEGDSFVKTTLYAYREWEEMTKMEKIMACYQHCSLKYISGESMSIDSLARRFNLVGDKKEEIINVLFDTMDQELIKKTDSSSIAEYVPFWI